MKAIKEKFFTKPIVLIKILDDNSLLIVDSDTTTRYFDKNTMEAKGGFKASITHLRYKNSVVSFSENGEYFSSLSADARETKLYNAKTKKIVAVMDKHRGEGSCTAIDPSKRYMFSCGDDGKIFVTDIKSGNIAFTLPSHIDTINDIDFSSNGNWVATAGYDKKIQLFHLATMTPKHKLTSHASAITKLKFLSNNRLFSVDKNNSALIWNIFSGVIVARLEGVHDDVSAVAVGGDNKFLFLGTYLGYVLVYELETYKQISKKYTKIHSTITTMEFDEQNNHLIIGADNGGLHIYNIFEGDAEVKTLLKNKEYDFIQKYIDKNPLLEYAQGYASLFILWEKSLEKATKCLENGDRKTAIALFAPFKNFPSKNKIMQNILAEYKEYDKFDTLISQGKIVLAYSMTNVHPLYKTTRIYKEMQEKWQKAFAMAQKYALDPKGLDRAREILAPYRGISEKTKLMQELFAQGEVYKRFRASLSQKDFTMVFRLIKQNSYLKEFPEYDMLMNYGDSLYIKSQTLIQSGETHSALKILRVLADFTDFAQEAKSSMIDIDNRHKFFKAISEKNLVQAYNLLTNSDDLQNTEDGKILQKQWDQDLALASSFAVKGNTQGVKKTIEKYMAMNSKYMSLAALFEWTYRMQLEKALKEHENQSIIEHGIKNYVFYFGVEDQIVSFFEKFINQYKESKLNIELLPKGSLGMWKPSMVVDSLLDSF